MAKIWLFMQKKIINSNSFARRTGLNFSSSFCSSDQQPQETFFGSHCYERKCQFSNSFLKLYLYSITLTVWLFHIFFLQHRSWVERTWLCCGYNIIAAVYCHAINSIQVWALWKSRGTVLQQSWLQRSTETALSELGLWEIFWLANTERHFYSMFSKWHFKIVKRELHSL